MTIEIPETILSIALLEGLTLNNPFTMEPMAGEPGSTDHFILPFYGAEPRIRI